MEIRCLLEDNKSATLYTFPCKRWLAKGEDDGAIVRELVPRDVTGEIVDKDGEVVSNKVEHQSLDGKKLTTAIKSVRENNCCSFVIDIERLNNVLLPTVFNFVNNIV